MNSKVFAVLLLLALLTCVLSEKYCPTPRNTSCKKMNIRNNCCRDSDCTSNAFCCAEPCGNFCHKASDKPGGRRVDPNASCQTGYVYW
uniref:U14-lycotoxin-Ls1a n=1 Tax=Lycosa singoriensis TaxID=434756 RepID=TXE05_LYCSI|nr:RecName: Full=U14-lycotoxin-Ls1a; AltName: Full=Toxin-like structure LSTX-N5; Flags: Precursor [Lycosa singoriensis]ACI41454.1 toxin-like structure LSTX-N5 precursor [Lycosa singoriensis]CAS03723.1 toxin-like structure LSTX-N5 precursor [Lycosa singoriensis]